MKMGGFQEMSDFVNPQHMSDEDAQTYGTIRCLRVSIKKMEEDNIEMKYRAKSNAEALVSCKAEVERLLKLIKESRQ